VAEEARAAGFGGSCGAAGGEGIPLSPFFLF